MYVSAFQCYFRLSLFFIFASQNIFLFDEFLVNPRMRKNRVFFYYAVWVVGENMYLKWVLT